MENTSVVAGKKASHLKCKSPKSSSNHCLNFLHEHFILEFLWKLYMKTLEFLSSCLGIKLTDVHFGGWMRSLFVCNNPLSPQLTTPILIYWHRGMNRKLLCAREVGSWELKERKEYFLLVEKAFLMLTRSLSSTLHMSFQLESLNFLPNLQHLHGALLDPTWNGCDKLWVKMLSYLVKVSLKCVELILLFCGSQTNELPSML